jgi:hypothetical protein
MSQDEFRIFLSAVSSEFGRARDAVAADLRSREALLRVQSDFRQEAGSGLSNYVRALGEPGRTKAEIEAALKSIWEAAREPPP